MHFLIDPIPGKAPQLISSFCPTELRNLRLNKGSTLPEVQWWCQAEGVGRWCILQFFFSRVSPFGQSLPQLLWGPLTYMVEDSLWVRTVDEVTSFAVRGLKTSGLGEYEVIPLSDTRKELFLQNHNPLNHCFSVIMEQISQEHIALLCSNHTEPISPYPRRALS